jgi:phosphatidylinositol glycan class Q protein
MEAVLIRGRKAVDTSYTGHYVLNRWDQLKRLKEVNTLRFGLWIAMDFVLGCLVAEAIRGEINADKLTDVALLGADEVVHYLRKLITWLMGAPAGLKLNSVLSMCLGRFFLYHIHLWVTFLHVTTPHVSHFLTHYCLEAMSKMGLCLQMCVIQDAFNLITFHIHCFYAYARRLFVSQSSGITSLWRLFRGKKYNPLRDRVDTSSNNGDQLFLGTLAFTILLFLYPTTLMYFAVFKVLEFVLTVINACVETITSFLSNLAVPPTEKNPIVWIH